MDACWNFNALVFCGSQTERWVSVPGEQRRREPGLGHSCPVGVRWGKLWWDNRWGQKFHQLPAQQGPSVISLTYTLCSTTRCHLHVNHIFTLCVLPRRRMSCEEALAHHWMAAFDSRDVATTKCLSKEKMKRFLARQKWKVTRLTSFFFFWVWGFSFLLQTL